MSILIDHSLPPFVTHRLHLAPPAPSQVYGIEHLLRLLTRLGPLVRPHMTAEEWAPFKEEMEGFVAWLGAGEKARVEQEAITQMSNADAWAK